MKILKNAVIGAMRCSRSAVKGLPVITLVAALLAPAPATASGSDRSGRAVASLYEMRTQNVVLQQWDLSCGAAALATVLRYQHGEDVTEHDVALGLIDRPEYYANPRLLQIRHGFSLLDMRRYLARLGYDGVGLGQMDFQELVQRAPVIVPVALQGYPHFVVFRGATDRRVLLADPAFGNVTVSLGKFRQAWIDYGDIGKVAFVVRRDGQSTPTAGKLAPDPDEFMVLR